MKDNQHWTFVCAALSVSLALPLIASAKGPSVPAPNIPLQNVETQEIISLTNEISKTEHTVIVFVSSECRDTSALPSRVRSLRTIVDGRPVSVVGVNSHLNQTAQNITSQRYRLGLEIPIFKDSDQILANYFGVHRSGEYLVFDQQGMMLQRGYFHDKAPEAIEARLSSDSATLTKLMSESEEQHASAYHAGCPIIRAR